MPEALSRFSLASLVRWSLSKLSNYQWVLLMVFFIVWLLAGYWERQRHEQFFEEVGNFIHRGERFTADDGRALKARIEALEAQSKPAANLPGTDRGTSQ